MSPSAHRAHETPTMDRATWRADTIRWRLRWEPGILNGNGLRPKGMRSRTFKRLQTSHDFHASAALAGMAVKFGLLGGRLGEIDADMDRWRQR